MEVILAQYPESETMHDELGAYPLRLDVAALPERRFFKMIRTLTIGVVMAGALMIILGVILNYQIAHQDVTVQRGNVWQFYRIDPQEKVLRTLESQTVTINPLRLYVEKMLYDYLMMRNSTAWDKKELEKNFGSTGLIAQLSSAAVLSDFAGEKSVLLSKTQAHGLIREAHIYDLRLTSSNLWVAYMEVFDLPQTNKSTVVCGCSDNSRSCLDCKIKNAKNRERYKIWIRTSFDRSKAGCRGLEGRCDNPLGISVDRYIVTFVPIHEDDVYWNLPPALQPEI